MSLSYISGCLSITMIPIVNYFNIWTFLPMVFLIIFITGNLVIDIRYIAKVSFSKIYEEMWEEIVVYVMIIMNILNIIFVAIYSYTFKFNTNSNYSMKSIIVLNIFLLLKFWTFNFILWIYTCIKSSIFIAEQKKDLENKDSQLDSKEEELVNKDNEIDYQKQELLLQKKIIAIISHECRNPLTILLLIFNELEQEVNKISKNNILDLCRQGNIACNGILCSLNDLKNDFQNNNIQHEIQIKPMINDLYNILKDIYSQQLMVFNQDKKLLKMTIEKKEYKVRVDYNQIFRGFIKLLDNSRKFISTDGSGTVEITITEQNYYYIVEVKDNGIGIKSDIIDKIFNEDFTDDQGTGNKGSGIGLNEISKIIKNHGGNISVESSTNIPTFTLFKVYIPIATNLTLEEENMYKNIYESNLSETYPIVSNEKNVKTILIVDDVLFIRKMMRGLINKIQNINIHLAEDGKIASELSQKNKYDLIFMDREMPEMSGPEACKEIRKINKEVVIIGITGHVLDEQRNDFFDSGANDVYDKPIDANTIKKIFSKYKI